MYLKMETVSEYGKCKFVSSFGIATSMDQSPIMSKNGAQYQFNFNNKVGETIYIRITDVNAFFMQVALNFKNPFILVTGDMDTTVPDDVQRWKEWCDHPKLIRWYAQNLSKKEIHPKLRHSPIGLDLHTLYLSGQTHDWGEYLTPLQQEHTLIECNLKHITQTNAKKAVTNFHLSTYGYPIRRQQYREPILKMCQTTDCVIWLPKQKRIDFWKSCDSCAFVICPFGNGLDTHRTWEVLCLGRIPIIPKSELNVLFEGLPVVEMDDSDWKKLSSSFLEKEYAKIVSKWDTYMWEKLTLQYWVNKIKTDT